MPLDEQDLAKIAELITAATGESEKKTTTMVNKAMGTLKPLKDRLEALPDPEALSTNIKTQFETLAADLAKKAPAAQGAGAPAVDEATKKLVEDLKTANEALMGKLRKGEDERRLERESRLAMEEKQAISTTLAKLSIRPGLMTAALNHLRATGMIKRSAEGEIVIERKDDVGTLEQVPLEEGLTAWTKTDEGKEFLPPKDAGGSGAGSGGGTRRGGGAGGLQMPSMAELAAAVRNTSGQ